MKLKIKSTICFFGCVFLASCNTGKSKKISNEKQLIQDCPEEQIINKMPTVGNSKKEPNTYYIYKGERKELSDFDMQWLEKNCKVKVTEVY